MRNKTRLKIFLIIIFVILLSVAIYTFINLDYIKQERFNHLQEKDMHNDSAARCIPNFELGITCE